MPQVPRLGIGQVEQEIKPMQQTNLQFQSMQTGIGNVGNAVSDIVQKEVEKADAVQLTSAQKELNDFYNARMYGDDDAMVKQKGTNAFGFKQKFDDEFNRKKEEIYGRLNGNAKNAFEGIATRSKMSADDTLVKYISGEKMKYEDDTYRGYLTSEIDVASNNYGDLNKVNMSLQNIENKTAEYLTKIRGINPNDPQFGQAMTEAKSGLHSSVIDRMVLDDRDVDATSYLKTYANQMTQKDYQQAQKLVEANSLRGQSQRFVDSVMSKGVDEAGAYKMAQQEFENDPKLREAAEQRIDLMYRRKQNAENEYQKNLFMNAVNIFDQSGGDMTKIPDKLLKQMKPEYRTALDSYRDRNPMLDDTTKYYELEKMAANPATAKKFAERDLMLDLPKLSKEHFDKLLGYQNAIRGGASKGGGRGGADDELNGLYTKQQYVEQRFKDAGQGFGNSKETNEKLSRFKLAVDADVNEFQKANGRKITRPELEKIVNSKLKEQVIEKGFFSDKKKPEYLIMVDDIPEETKAEIETRLKFQGKPATDDNIVEQYKRILNSL